MWSVRASPGAIGCVGTGGIPKAICPGAPGIPKAAPLGGTGAMPGMPGCAAGCTPSCAVLEVARGSKASANPSPPLPLLGGAELKAPNSGCFRGSRRWRCHEIIPEQIWRRGRGRGRNGHALRVRHPDHSMNFLA